jgi:hypothetical protein
MLLNVVLDERKNSYGSFNDNSILTDYLYGCIKKRIEFEPPFIKEALHMICHKVARAVNGEVDYKDNWVDIAGYSQCVIDILKKQPNTLNEYPTVYIHEAFLKPLSAPPITVNNYANWTPYKGFLIQGVLHYIQLGAYSGNLRNVANWENIKKSALDSLEYINNKEVQNNVTAH